MSSARFPDRNFRATGRRSIAVFCATAVILLGFACWAIFDILTQPELSLVSKVSTLVTIIVATVILTLMPAGLMRSLRVMAESEKLILLAPGYYAERLMIMTLDGILFNINHAEGSEALQRDIRDLSLAYVNADEGELRRLLTLFNEMLVRAVRKANLLCDREELEAKLRSFWECWTEELLSPVFEETILAVCALETGDNLD